MGRAPLLPLCILLAACGGHSARVEHVSNGGSGGVSNAAGSAGDGAGLGGGGSSAAGTLGSGAAGAAGAAGGAAGATTYVDAAKHCPSGLDYFVSIGGDLPERRLTKSCSDVDGLVSVAYYDSGSALDPGLKQLAAIIACDGSERIEVWRMPPYPDALATAGVYVDQNAVTYSTCSTSRLVSDSAGCMPVGSMTFAESDVRYVFEGDYTMPLFQDGKSYQVSGSFRVCSDR
jgi:hypothetical protein